MQGDHSCTYLLLTPSLSPPNNRIVYLPISMPRRGDLEVWGWWYQHQRSWLRTFWYCSALAGVYGWSSSLASYSELCCLASKVTLTLIPYKTVLWRTALLNPLPSAEQQFLLFKRGRADTALKIESHSISQRNEWISWHFWKTKMGNIFFLQLKASLTLDGGLFSLGMPF